MSSEFLKYYRSIIIEDQNTKSQQSAKKQTVKKSSTEKNIYQDLQDAKNQALNANIPDCTEEIANAAQTEIKQTYNVNKALFDDIQQSSSEKDSTPTSSVIKQSVVNNILSNKFNEFYNLVLQNNIVKEAKTQQVSSNNYVLVVNDDHTFRLVNDEDTNTKFSIDDYRKVDKWIENNKESWFAMAKKFGGGSTNIGEEEIQDVLNNFKIVKLNNKQKVKKILLTIKNLRYFKELGGLYSALNKKEGFIPDEDKKKIRTAYLNVLIFIINAVQDKAPNKAERAEIKKEKDKHDKTKRENQKQHKKFNDFKTACKNWSENNSQSITLLIDGGNKDINEKDPLLDLNGTDDVYLNVNIKLYNYKGKHVADWNATETDFSDKELRNKLGNLLRNNQQSIVSTNDLPLHVESIKDLLNGCRCSDKDEKNDNDYQLFNNYRNKLIQSIKDILQKYPNLTLSKLVKDYKPVQQEKF